MACKNVCRLCDRLILSTAVNFDATNNQVIVALPAGSYANGEKYCIVIAQAIPTSATISSQVVFSIGTGATRYQLVDKCCTPVTACGIKTRTKYSTRVQTTNTTGVFRMLGEPCCKQDTLPSIPAS